MNEGLMLKAYDVGGTVHEPFTLEVENGKMLINQKVPLSSCKQWLIF